MWLLRIALRITTNTVALNILTDYQGAKKPIKHKDMTKTMQLIVDYCATNIWEWEDRVQLALAKIDRWRCPLSQADNSLYNDILSAIEDCATDYEIDVDDIDVEEIIWL